MEKGNEKVKEKEWENITILELKAASHQWLRSAVLKVDIEGFIVATQDQSLFTRNFQANILHKGADPRRRSCNTSTRLLTTSSQGTQFLPQMSIQRDIIVLDNIYTEKSVTIIILKHSTNGMSTNGYLL